MRKKLDWEDEGTQYVILAGGRLAFRLFRIQPRSHLASGLSVSTHLASTTTFRHLTGQHLFRGAIIESGAYMYHDVPSLATYQTLSNTFAQKDASAFCGGS